MLERDLDDRVCCSIWIQFMYTSDHLSFKDTVISIIFITTVLSLSFFLSSSIFQMTLN